MPPATTISVAFGELFDVESWCVAHPQAAVYIAAFCLWVSVALVIRMWVLYRRVSLVKKLIWSVVLLVPFFGWFFYGGCFQIPDYHNTPIGPGDSSGG